MKCVINTVYAIRLENSICFHWYKRVGRVNNVSYYIFDKKKQKTQKHEGKIILFYTFIIEIVCKISLLEFLIRLFLTFFYGIFSNNIQVSLIDLTISCFTIN